NADLRFVVDGEGRIEGRPRLVGERLSMTEPLPDLLAEMRRERRENEREGFRRFARNFLFGLKMAREDHHGADGRVEAEVLDVLRDLLDRLVNEPLGLHVVLAADFAGR